MLERGGSSEQSGPYYQNSWAALRMGRLIDPTPQLSPADTIIKVRTEAFAKVDDVVVTFGDGHKEWVQCKENLAPKSDPWNKLWGQFAAQIDAPEFQPDVDRLVLQIGWPQEEHEQLKAMSMRAHSEDETEWLIRMTIAQKTLLELAKAKLPSNYQSTVAQWRLFRHLDVRVELLENLQEQALYWMPPASVNAATLFDTLRAIVSEGGRVRRSFTRDQAVHILGNERGITLNAPLPLAEVHKSLREVNATLVSHPDFIGSKQHKIERTVVDEIANWLQQRNGEKSLGVLLNGAGMGKSAVLKRVVEKMEATTIPLLAIKADLQLSDTEAWKQLGEQLGELESIERTIRRFPLVEGAPRFILVIDQIDALSLAMSGDQKSLHIALSLIERAQRIEGVRVLVSCRQFDLKNDPQLSRLEHAKKFHLAQLEDEEVKETLAVTSPQMQGVWLPPALKQLLRTPLHLKLFVQAVENMDEQDLKLEVLQSLTDLYSRLWELIVERLDSKLPQVEVRIEALRRLSEALTQQQSVSISGQAWLYTAGNNIEFEQAANYLATTGLVTRNGNSQWAFAHQTFYDYCYARFRVEDCLAAGRSIAQEVVDGPMDLRARPQILQLLGYLRGRHANTFVVELETLLRAPELELHLLDLIVRWFGALRSPSDREWALMEGLLFEGESASGMSLASLLGAMGYNLAWFERLRGETLRELWEQMQPQNIYAVTRYFQSVAHGNNWHVVEELQPILSQGFAGKREENIDRIDEILQVFVSWEDKKVAEFYVQFIEAVTPIQTFETDQSVRFHPLRQIAKFHPQMFCRVAKVLSYRAWERSTEEREKNRKEREVEANTQAEETDKEALDRNFFEGIRQNSRREHREEQPLSMIGHALRGDSEHELMEEIAANHPLLWVENFLPWCELLFSTSRFEFELKEESSYFHEDGLSLTYHYAHSDLRVLHRCALDRAFQKLACEHHQKFQEIYSQLEPIKTESVQSLLSHALRADPEKWHTLALEFLLGDQRRLKMAEEQWETRQLTMAIAPHLSEAQFRSLEIEVLQFEPVQYYFDDEDRENNLRWVGLEQLNLLRSLPLERLSKEAQERLSQWETKFPKYRAKEQEPSIFTSIAKDVVSPISPEEIAGMSDKQWLSILGEHDLYSRSKWHDDPDEAYHRGGAQEIAAQLQGRTVEEPARFGCLAVGDFPDDVDSVYLSAIVRGLARACIEDNGGAGVVARSWTFDFALKFGPLLQESIEALKFKIRDLDGIESPSEIQKENLGKQMTGLRFSEAALQHLCEGLCQVIANERKAPLPTPVTNFLLSVWQGPADDTENYYKKRDVIDSADDGVNDGPYGAYKRSARGQALQALWWACETATADSVEVRRQRWSLIDKAASQDSTSLRAGAVRLLLSDFHEDRETAVALFMKLAQDHPRVLHSHWTHEFIVYNSHRALPQFESMLSELLNEANSQANSKIEANHRHKGLGFRVGLLFGRIHLSLLDSPSAHTEVATAWVFKARSGAASVRAGLAYVYAENAAETSVTKVCLENLQVFLNDDSVHVRETILRVFTQLGKRHLRGFASFFEAFAESKTWRDGMRVFSSYLHKHGSTQADWSLCIVEKLLDNVHPMREDRRTDPEITPLVRLVLHIYENSSSATLSKRSMHLFGRLMQQSPHYAGMVLREWDER